MTDKSPIPINALDRQFASCGTLLESAAQRVLQQGWYVMGPELEQFERRFAQYCAVKNCVGVANGTDALELALAALDVGRGDEVALVANAGMYATHATLARGAAPLYVDIEDETLIMSPDRLAATITSKTKAIILTHLYGRIGQFDRISGIANDHRIPIIEDCAQAHGALYENKRAGSLGVIGCFSFYPTKNLGACGDAGALTTDDDELALRLRSLRQYGWKAKYRVELNGGRNSRLDEIQAAILLAKLPMLETWNAKRRAVAKIFIDQIRHPNIQLPRSCSTDDVAHLFVVRTDARDSLRQHLLNHGIHSDVHYPIPDHRQPCCTNHFSKLTLPVTEAVAAQVLTLPCFPELQDDEVKRIVEACNTWCVSKD